MKRTLRLILLPILTIAMCVCLITGATFALFSSESDSNIAITSGKVDVKATIQNANMASTLPGSSGSYAAMGSAQVEADGSLSVNNFTPGDYVTFDIAIDNKSTIDVQWQLKITAEDGDELFKLLEFSAEGYNLTNTGKADLSDWHTLSANSTPESLHVRIWLPESVSVAQGQTVKMVASVLAVQANAETVNPVAPDPVDTINTYIYDLESFKQFAQATESDDYHGKVVHLMENIDLKGEEWEPIYQFNGTFEGNNQVISNLYVNKPTTAGVGLFAHVTSGRVKNIILENIDVTGKEQVAALTGGAFTAPEISGITVRGDIKIVGNYKVGAISGDSYGYFSNCVVNGLPGSYIKGVYQAENYEGDNIGGILGYAGEQNDTETHITNCHVSGVDISGTRKIGGVIGYLHYGVSVANSSYSDGVITCTANDDYIAAKGIAMIQLGGIAGQAHHEGAAQSLIDNSVNNITINAPKTFTFETVCKGREVLTSAILGGVRKCDESAGINHAAIIEAEGNTATNVTFNAKLNGVYYSENSIPYASHVRVYNVEDVENLIAAMAEAKVINLYAMKNENHLVVEFAEGVFDFQGKEWQPINGWRTDFIGHNTVIRNMNMSKSQMWAGFISNGGDSNISGITFENGTLIGEQAGIIVGHSDNVHISDVTIKGEFTVSYGEKGSESCPGVGVLIGATAGSLQTVASTEIAEGCVVTINPKDLVPGTSFNKVSDNYYIGYIYTSEVPTANVTLNGQIYVNIADGLAIKYQKNENNKVNRSYVVSNAAGFFTVAKMRNDEELTAGEGGVLYIELANDIDLEGEQYTPMSGHWVSFDGKGFVIKNMNAVGANEKKQAGLFSYGGAAKISNLTLRNVNVTGSQAGAFIGNHTGATITNCRLEGEINITYVPSSETYYALGVFVGVASEGASTFSNTVLAAGAKATLDFTGFTTNAKAIDFLAGYKAAGSVKDMPVQEDGAEVTVKGLADMDVTGSTSIPNAPTWGINVDDGANIVIDGAKADGSKMTVEFAHTAFNNGDGLEGIASGTIIIRNVHFKHIGDGEDAMQGFAMTLGFGSTAQVRFENCVFENMWCAVYCNGHDYGTGATKGDSHVVIENCEFITTRYGYAVNYVEDLWTAQNPTGIHVEIVGTHVGLEEADFMEPRS